MTDGGGFRLIAITMRDTVTEAAEAQRVSGPLAVRLAELMAAAVLLRETTSPGRRVQISLRDLDGGSLVADSLPDGTTRCLVNPGEENPERLGQNGVMKVTYTLPNGALHAGVVQVEGNDIAGAMMTYLQESEQILSSLSVAAVGASSALTAAGFVVQLLPEVEREPLEHMTDRLDKLEGLASLLSRDQPTPDDLIERVLAGYEYTVLADSAIWFGCNCSRERIYATLASLGDDLDAMVADAEPLEIRCEACGKSYELSTAEVRLVAESRAVH